MNKKLFILLGVIMVLSTVSISGCAAAPEDERVSDGVWCYLPEFPPAYNEWVGVNLYRTTTDIGEWTGIFEGESVESGFIVSQYPTGRALFIAVVTFNSVDVGGKSGGLEMYVIGDRPDKKTDWEGTWVITDGTGELADLKGEGDWWGPGYQDYPEECGVIYYSAGNLDV